jgi:hypothetical protein
LGRSYRAGSKSANRYELTTILRMPQLLEVALLIAGVFQLVCILLLIFPTFSGSPRRKAEHEPEPLAHAGARRSQGGG